MLVELRLAANLCRVCINQVQKSAKDNGRVLFFPCGDKLDPDIIWLQTGRTPFERKFLAQTKLAELQKTIDTLTAQRDEVTSRAAMLDARVEELAQRVRDRERELDQKEEVAKDRRGCIWSPRPMRLFAILPCLTT